ncbi:non-LTR retroelement reverse transcriptase-like [Gossypium australe]|uniref:Non-LTR retroelement reverse transcriptase-like n=1 Tax=Gossypium australe TaxID=47621 RepID=A0A5B6W412_9ROSI|nr:non-LTR retroelement reverse transcriptase-like [Gossypium australe]
MAPISLDLAPGERDRFSWKCTPDGKFTFRSAYELLSRNNNTDADMSWKAIWKLKVPERICTFLWLVLHGRIMTNERRARMGLASTAQCERCTTLSEDMLHLLRDCPISRSLWLRMVPTSLQREFFECGTSEWIKANILCRTRARHGTEWNVLFAVSLWWLWKWRNESIFQGNDPPRTQPRRQERLISWKPPPSGWTLINTDGASRGNPGSAAAAVCLRDDTGKWVARSVTNLGICSAALAEIMAVYQGLKLAWDYGIRKCILESDSELALSWLRTEPDPSHQFAHLISGCRQLLRRPWTTQMRHIYREGNRVADWLAKFGTSLSLGTYLYPLPPRGVLGILVEDASGYAMIMNVIVSEEDE